MRRVALCALSLWLFSSAFVQAQRGSFTPGSSLANDDYLDWADRDNAPWAAAGSSFERNNPARTRIPPWAVRTYPPEAFENPPIIIQAPPPNVQIVQPPPEIWVIEEVAPEREAPAAREEERLEEAPPASPAEAEEGGAEQEG